MLERIIIIRSSIKTADNNYPLQHQNIWAFWGRQKVANTYKISPDPASRFTCYSNPGEADEDGADISVCFHVNAENFFDPLPVFLCFEKKHYNQKNPKLNLYSHFMVYL